MAASAMCLSHAQLVQCREYIPAVAVSVDSAQSSLDAARAIDPRVRVRGILGVQFSFLWESRCAVIAFRHVWTRVLVCGRLERLACCFYGFDIHKHNIDMKGAMG
eukprot:1193996-Prorocentrum_minimum.AAC.8